MSRPTSLSDTTLDGLTEIISEKPNDLAAEVAIARLYRAAAEGENASVDGATISENPSTRRLWESAETHALKVLSMEPRPNDARKQAIDIMYAKTFDFGEFTAATKYGVELVQTRRSAKDAYNLGLSLGRLQRFSDAEDAFLEAIRIDATYSDPYRSLSKLYSRINPELAAQVRETAMLIEARQALKQVILSPLGE